MKTVHVFITGVVQGVGYRAWVKYQADTIHVTGWVKNCMDENTVEAVFSGTTDDITHLIAQLYIGPSSALVKDIIKTDSVNPTLPYRQFSVLQ